MPNKAKSLVRDAGAGARRARARGAGPTNGGASRSDVLARLKQLWALPNDLLCVIGNDGRIKMVNPAWRRVLGWSDRDLVGSDPIDLVEREDADAIREQLRIARMAGRLERIEVRCRHADGSLRWLSWSGHRSEGEWYVIAKDVTALKTAETELARSEGHSRALLRALSDGLCVVDGAGRIREVSERFCEMTGFGEDELIGAAPPLPYWPEDEQESIGRTFQAALRTAAGHLELTFQRKSGERFPAWIEVSALAETNGDGEPGFLAVVRDASRELAERQKLRDAQRIGGIGSFEVDYRSGRVEFSQELSRLLGVDAEPFARGLAEAREIVRAPDGKRIQRLGAETLADGQPRELAHRYLRGQEVRWAETRIEPLSENGERYGVRGTLQDITERMRAEREIHLQAHLLDAVDVAVIATDLDGTVTHWNRGAQRMYGWKRDEMLGRSVNDLTVGPHDEAPVEEITEAVGQTGVREGEFTVRRKDGSSFPAYIRDVLFRDPDGQPAGLVGVSVDITERVETGRQMQAARDYLRTITDSMGDGLFTLDTHGRLIYINPAGEKLLGWSQAELIGEVMHEMTHHRCVDGSPVSLEDCPIFQARSEGDVVRVEDDIFIRKDGSALPVEITAAPFQTEEGVRGTVVVFSDISERKTKERRLREQVEASSEVERIRDALAEDRFVLYAQPIIDVTSGETVQHELLIRLRDSSGAIVLPREFLTAAEESGLIVDIDRWVVRQAVWLAKAGHAVELNLSAHSLSGPGLIDDFRNELERTSTDPSLIVVELTETALLADEQAAELFIERVTALGCKLALDDFGTGYGGFTYLKRLPVDFLKIDIEFVRDLPSNQASQHVVKAIVSLANGFGQRTVAEGVEDETTLRMLRDFGVDYGQGYGIARPRPVAEVLP